jgi:hypothetical protein
MRRTSANRPRCSLSIGTQVSTVNKSTRQSMLPKWKCLAIGLDEAKVQIRIENVARPQHAFGEVRSHSIVVSTLR